MGETGDILENWATQVRKGLLELCVLNAIGERERYAYDLVRSLVEVPGLGMTEGTIYPLLSRLRGQGWIQARLEESPSGPARKYYALTREGRRILTAMNEHWDALGASVDLLRDHKRR